MSAPRDMTPEQAQQYFTAAELAEFSAARCLIGFPASERGIRQLAQREGWNDMPSHLSRARPSAKAGGRPSTEYHLSLLPEAVQSVIAGMVMQRTVQERHDSSAGELARLSALRAASLPAHARDVLHARLEVLTSIEGFAVSRSQSRSWGITQFLTAQDAFRTRQEIELRRDRGDILTDAEVLSLSKPLLLTSEEGFGLNPQRICVANDRRGKAEVKRSAIYDWFRLRDAQGATSLAPAATRVQSPIPDWFSGFLKFYARPSRPDASDALNEYLKTLPAGADRPTLTQVRYILRNRLNNIERHVGREGMLTLRSRLAYVTRTTEDMLPTTIYSADGKTFDAEISDPQTSRPIRPEITTVIDVVTRRIVGISLARSENQRSVAEALRNSCVACGVPAIFYVDRGPGYRNAAMDADVSGLMGRLGITKSHAAPYGSQAKGRIERPNATVWDVLAKRLPTYIGQDMDKEAGGKVHKITRREIAEFGQSRLLPSWPDFVRLCLDRVAEYNATPHRSLPRFADPETGRLRHMSPDECWAAHVANGFQPVEVDPTEADDLFRPYEIRTARRAQVQWNGNYYFDDALERYHEEKVMVGYDYHQADKVWVRELDLDSGQPGRLICVARFGGNSERYFPVSFEQKAVETRANARLRRVQNKIDAIEEERDAQVQIEQQYVQPAEFIDLGGHELEPDPVTLAVDHGVPASPQAPRRQTFASDEELAAWALAHPDQLRPTQIAVLQRCLSRPISRENLRANGIDTEALRNLLRAAAA